MQGLLDDHINRRKANIAKGFINNDLEKAEGSRGGKVIGHTKSGKPIYAEKKAGEYKDFTPDDHHDAHVSHAKAYDSFRGKVPTKGAPRDTNVDKQMAHHLKEGGEHYSKSSEGIAKSAKDVKTKVGELSKHKDADEEHFWDVVSQHYTPKDDGESEHTTLNKLAKHKHYDKIIAKLKNKK